MSFATERKTAWFAKYFLQAVAAQYLLSVRIIGLILVAVHIAHGTERNIKLIASTPIITCSRARFLVHPAVHFVADGDWHLRRIPLKAWH